MRLAKHRCSVSSNEEAKYTLRSSLIVPERPYRQLSAGKLILIVSSIQTSGLVIMGSLIWDTKNTFVYTMDPNEFARGKNHINGIESSGLMQNADWKNSHGIHKSTFYLHLKDVNSDSIIVTKISILYC